MRVYLINIFIVTILSFAALLLGNEKNDLGYVKPFKFLSFFVFLSLFLVSALRWKVGTDYYEYTKLFEIAPTYTYSEIISDKFPELLYSTVTWVSMNLFNNPKVTFAIYSFLICYFFTKAISKYSSNYTLSIILYILTMSYYNSFNGILQWTASGVIVLGYKHILQRNFKRYLVYIIIATMFHSTAIIMLPVYFIVNKEIFSINNLILCIIAGICFIFFNSFVEVLLKLIQGTSYAHYSEWFETGGRTANPLRFLVACVPSLFSIILYSNKIVKKENQIKILTNLSILNSLCMLVATQNYIFARFSIYFDIYNVFLLPLLIEKIEKKEARILTFIMLVGYFIYMYLLLPVDSNLLPYRTIFQSY